MSCFDEEPDGDPHGECAAEISRLKAVQDGLVAALKTALRYVDVEGDIHDRQQIREALHAAGVEVKP